ncbi:winged helix-turn-helix domain-containing protein [Herpetosiphon geysericola]|uniref:winged helix-turn-helix domain-containing protein n=1 Tax=Herpetosiphon geysericola TaxID=70996 RepID=UPI0006C92BD0|nr:winged helix-turn-helix domain-containing protein [Herpetosiphon geysericola]
MADIGYLLITYSADRDTTWDPIYLRHEVTYLGRPAPDETKPYIKLDILSVSRVHARIVYTNQEYILENIKGQYRIGLFEQELAIGQSHTLRHGTIFQIPNRSDEFFRIIFLLNDKTQVLPLDIDESSQRVMVFGDYISVTGLEFTLLKYLYWHRGMLCTYTDIINALWPDDRYSGGRRSELDVLLSRIRSKIRSASGGFTFLQTIRTEGIRLVV